MHTTHWWIPRACEQISFWGCEPRRTWLVFLSLSTEFMKIGRDCAISYLSVRSRNRKEGCNYPSSGTIQRTSWNGFNGRFISFPSHVSSVNYNSASLTERVAICVRTRCSTRRGCGDHTSGKTAFIAVFITTLTLPAVERG